MNEIKNVDFQMSFTNGPEKFFQYDMEELLENVPDELKNNPAFMKEVQSLADTKFPDDGPLNEHVTASPLVEVFAVSIHSYKSTLFNDGKPCEVYGEVKVTNVDTTDHLYKRVEEESEIVCLGGSLSLTGPTSSIVPYLTTKLNIHLRDRVRDIEIARGQIDLDFRTEDESEALKVGFVQGECGFAAVLYTTLRSAVLAK